MQSFKLLLAVLVLSVGFSAFTAGIIETAKVDTAASEITWKGYKVTGEHAGTIKIKEGKLDYEAGILQGGSFTIDMNSITCTDLEGEYKGQLEGHLKSPDFFGVEKYPTAKLNITDVAANGVNRYKVTADLTIKETTKPVKFIVNTTEENGKIVAVSDIQIDRTEYDVRYGSGSFFDSLGDKTIYDEFDLSVKLVANK